MAALWKHTPCRICMCVDTSWYHLPLLLLFPFHPILPCLTIAPMSRRQEINIQISEELPWSEVWAWLLCLLDGGTGLHRWKWKYKRTWFSIWLHYLGAICPWTSCLTSLSFSFLFCKIRVLILPLENCLQGLNELVIARCLTQWPGSLFIVINDI